MAKAGIVKAKRTGVVPNCPEKASGESTTSSTSGGIVALSKDDMVAYLVNKGLDGDMDTVNAFTDKVIRGKAKAMMVKIKRGAVDRPPMPEISESGTVSDSTQPQEETEEFHRIVHFLDITN